MASSVESKVVSMKFDNKQFSDGVRGTMSMLDKLKNSLNFSGSKQSLEELKAAGNKFNMQGMEGSINGISAGFAALATVGITALANITNKAVDAGLRIAKSLSLQPVMEGFAEYETNMNSIQTIMSNTAKHGTTLEDVNGALDELNTYADQTIYNFSEMTRNIGTFTAAGVKLDESVRSIKGIANLAAMSGSNSQQASTAMYQLSQAIAAGSVKLMDWNSVVNAGMGGKLFQEALFNTGKAMGTITNVPVGTTFDEWEASGNKFRETLQDGWLTAEVLTTTLEGFTGELSAAELSAKGFSDEQVVAIQKMGDMATKAATEIKTGTQLVSVIQEAIGSGWSTTFRTVIGDFVEAKNLMTVFGNGIGDAIGRISDARNEVLAGWKMFGGRQMAIEGLILGLNAILTALRPIKEAFREVFPRKTSADLIAMTQSFRDLMIRLKMGEGTVKAIKNVFLGFFSVFRIGWEVVKGFISLFSTIAKSFGFVGGGALAAAGGFGVVISKIREALVEGGAIMGLFRLVGTVIGTVGRLIGYVFKGIFGGVGNLGGVFSDAGGTIMDFIESASSRLNDLRNAFINAGGKIFEWADKIIDFFGGGVRAIQSGVSSGISGAIETVKDAFDSMSPAVDGAKDSISNIGKVFSAVGSVLAKIGSGIWNFAKTIIDAIGGIADKIFGVFGADSLAKATSNIDTVLLGGIAALLVKFLKDGIKLDFGQSSLFDSIKDSFGQLTDTLKTMQTSVRADAILKIAAAMGVLTVSLLVISAMDTDSLVRGLVGIGVGMGALVSAMVLMDKHASSNNPTKMVGLATSMILVSGAMVILAAAIRRFGALDTDQLIKGLVGMGVSFAILVTMANKLEKSGLKMASVGLALIPLSAGLWLLSKAVGSFGNVPFGTMLQGLLAMGAALAAITVAINFMPASDMITLGFGFILFAKGLDMISDAILMFAAIKLGDMVKGLAGIGASLAIIGSTMKLMPQKKMISMGAGLILVAGALWVMAVAIEKMGTIGMLELVKGLGALAIVLGVVSMAMYVMSSAAGGAVAMVAAAGALYVLAMVVKTIGELPFGTILTGILGIAGVIAVLAVAALLVTPILPAMLALGIALVAIGAGFALFGYGASATATALSKLGDVGKESIGKLIDVFNEILKALPGFVKTFADAIIQLVMHLLKAAPKMIDAFGNVIESFLKKIVELTPVIGEALGALISMGIGVIREKLPEFLLLGFELITGLLTGIANNMPMIVEGGVGIIVGFIQGLTKSLPKVVKAVAVLVMTMLVELTRYGVQIANVGTALLVKFLASLSGNISKVATAITTLITNLITEIGKGATRIATAGTNALIQFLNGMKNNTLKVIGKFAEVLKNLISGVANAVVDVTRHASKTLIKFLNAIADVAEEDTGQIVSAFGRIGRGIITGMAKGIRDNGGKLVQAVKDALGGLFGFVADALGIKSPSRVYAEVGKYIMQGMAVGIGRGEQDVTAAAYSAVDKTKDAFADALSTIPGVLGDIGEINPVIAPVLDLSAVETEAKRLSSIFVPQTIEADVSTRNANLIAKVTADEASPEPAPAATGPTEIKFEQTINSPVALTTNEIYRNTRSQLAIAKEELSIP